MPHTSPEQGLWIPRGDKIDDEDHRDDEQPSEESGSQKGGSDEEESEGGSEAGYDENGDDDIRGDTPVKGTSGRFGALAIGSDDSEEDEDE